jgi:flagellar biosynthetic protein FliR
MGFALDQLGVDTGAISRLIFAVVLIAARIVPVFTLAPFFGGRLVPAPVRVGIAIAFSVLLLPTVGDPVTAAWAVDPGPVLVATLIAKEILVGLALGFIASLPFFAVDAAGRLADVARGASQSQLLNPQTGERTTPLGDFGLQLAILIFLFLDGHLLVIQSLATSYEALPVLSHTTTGGWGGVSQVAITASAHMIAVAIGLAAPVLAATFLADLSLGLVNRVAPQVQVYFVGMPAKAIVGVFVFMIALAALAVAVGGETLGGVSSIGEVIRALAAHLER